MKLLIPLVREIKLYNCQENVREFWKSLAAASMKMDYAAEV